MSAGDSGGAALVVEGLTHRHAGATEPTLREVSFTVPAGAIAVVIGESGSGKTTLLRCLAGLDHGERGTITIGARTVAASHAARATLRGRVGLVFQSFELFPHLSVLENCVLAPMQVRRTPRSAAEAAARALLADLGLADKAESHPSRLSGGQCQRVAIARALAMAPACLLYDEPTSALDHARKREVAEILGAVRATGMTQLVVTHDASLVSTIADLVFRLEGGRLVPVPR